MHVYFIRHGKAVEPGAAGEWERPLSQAGAEEMMRIAQRLRSLGLYCDHLWTSPLARARQTAELLCAAGVAETAAVASFLQPGGSFSELVAVLEGNRGQESLGLVGHLPDLPRFAEILLWGRPTGALAMQPGGVIGVEINDGAALDGGGILFWLTSPRLLLGS